MRLYASIPNPTVQGEHLSTRVILGTHDEATDRFDPAWDVVAIPGGFIQAYSLRSVYDPARANLWRDMLSSSNGPKEWNIRIQPATVGTFVTLDWSESDLAVLPDGIQIRLIDLGAANREVDMKAATSYNYMHPDPLVARQFRIILEEGPAPSPPKEVSPPGKGIKGDGLPPGQLRRPYQTRLEVDGGAEPYRWEIVSGRLPIGLQLDSGTGEISGRPARLGRYRIMLQAVDAEGLVYQRAMDLVIQR